MKKVRVEDAAGMVLCHDLTRIVKGGFKGAQFRKGHIVREEDIPVLLSMGKQSIFVWEKQIGMLHEDEAAERLANICCGENTSCGTPVEGKIELSAVCSGVFCFDPFVLQQINSVDSVTVAARHAWSAVKTGEKLAGMRVIPLVIPEALIQEAEKHAENKKLFSVKPYIKKSACIVTTGSEIAKGLIKDSFTPVLIEKLSQFDIRVVKHIIVDDSTDNIINAIKEARSQKPDILLCTGGMSVDPDDSTPAAIKMSGAEIVSYGAPVLPGSMFLLGYYPEGCAVMGLPGCVMYHKATIFDIALPRAAAGIKMSKNDFTALGNGGLCLSCKECTYPVCPFGK
ncbi:MAG: molybdopterin-binding protein [Spirochaetaceae bacterium]|jgi:molybdopterin biosynthesis enzyme|nr:molybdopterin-binding protein [Spirochaetaceae bacterium]